MSESSDPIRAAVDGSSLGNPGPAGWAWVVDRDHWDAGGWPSGTNNLGELTAVLELLRATDTDELRGRRLEILADSQYAINVITKWAPSWKKKGWQKADKKPIANLEVIQEIDRLIASRDAHFAWVRGHAGHDLNELADTHARGAAEAYRDGRAPEPGPGFASVSGSGFESSPGSGCASPIDEGDPPAVDCAATIRRRQKSLIRAWASLNVKELGTYEAEGARIIDHEGHDRLELRDVPIRPGESCRVSRIEICEGGANMWIATFTISGSDATWPGTIRITHMWAGSSADTARVIWQQFTPVVDAG